eukprot:6456670-Amphidinium_carterae.2
MLAEIASAIAWKKRGRTKREISIVLENLCRRDAVLQAGFPHWAAFAPRFQDILRLGCSWLDILKAEFQPPPGIQEHTHKQDPQTPATSTS